MGVHNGGSSRAETVSFPYVERQKLMGGTLAIITTCGASSVWFRSGYIGALLGPERTRECLISDDDLRNKGTEVFLR